MKKQLSELSKEDFSRLACRQPNLDGEWIYRLEQTELGDTPKTPYPRFELGVTNRFFFRTLDEAEEFMRKADREVEIYRNEVLQIPLGKNAGYIGACWLYDGNGELLDYSTTVRDGAPEDTHFFGRPKERQRFKEGDIVEVFDGKYAYLALLISNPPDVEWCWNYYLRGNSKKYPMLYALDDTDDSGIVLEGPDYSWHSHLSTLAMMKPRYPIPHELEEEIKSWGKREEEAFRAAKQAEDNGETMPCHTVRRGEYMCEVAPLSLHIHFDDNTEFPHIHLSDGYGLDVALRMDSPQYYSHDGCDGRLSNSQIDALTDYLSEFKLGKTNWWFLIHKWNEDEYGKELPGDMPMPDYTRLKTV